MKYQIKEDHATFLEVVIEGALDKNTLFMAMNDLLGHPQYYQKNTLWNFLNARMGISLQDIKEIVGMMQMFKPAKQEFANKAALLVTGKMNYSLASIFVGMTALLPFQYKVFSKLSEALDYLNEE